MANDLARFNGSKAVPLPSRNWETDWPMDGVPWHPCCMPPTSETADPLSRPDLERLIVPRRSDQRSDERPVATATLDIPKTLCG